MKTDGHFDGLTSIPAFINRSYFCFDCNRGYDHESAEHHNCFGQNCPGCLRRNKKCPNYAAWLKPNFECRDCHCLFYGEDCLEQHKKDKLCGKYRRCLVCAQEYQVDKKKPHKCYHSTCRNCKQFVNISEHLCYIQPEIEEEKETVEEAEDFEDPLQWGESDDNEDQKQPPPSPLLVYADFECMLDAKNQFIPDLICYATSEDDTVVSHFGLDCAEKFVHDLDDLTEVEDNEKERDIHVFFHNMKGFDATFSMDELYKQQREVVNQLTVGAKVLHFQSGTIHFKDSMCFLPFALEKFPATFHLTELKKGFFCHKFHVEANLLYEGRIPNVEYYDPDSMDPKKKAAFLAWHADQVARNVVFNFKKELQEYCESDVQLLKAGCEKFVEEFSSIAGFNPLLRCVTIASACNLFWRKKLLQPDLIAVEPVHGWHGAQVNQSKVALEWLYFEESKLDGDNEIKFVRNGGEQRVLTAAGSYFVDGFNPRTNTVYEFHGCYYLGCVKCFKNSRHQRRNCHSD